MDIWEQKFKTNACPKPSKKIQLPKFADTTCLLKTALSISGDNLYAESVNVNSVSPFEVHRGDVAWIP